jgi:hypothetical protein
MTVAEIVRIGLLAVYGVGLLVSLAAVRQAWRIIPTSMYVPIGWHRHETVWEWPKWLALGFVTVFALACTAVGCWMAWVSINDPFQQRSALPLVIHALVSPILVVIWLRTSVNELRRRGRRLRA